MHQFLPSCGHTQAVDRIEICVAFSNKSANFFANVGCFSFMPLLFPKKKPAEAGFLGLTPKQFGVRASANKNHAVSLQSVNQQQVTFCMAFPVICPFALQFMVKPFGG